MFLHFWNYCVTCWYTERLTDCDWSAGLKSWTWTRTLGLIINLRLLGIKPTKYIWYTVIYVIPTHPPASFTRLQIIPAAFSQSEIDTHNSAFTSSDSHECETFRWMRPTLRSDTLKIKAIDLCPSRDTFPAWHAVLLCGLSVSETVCACAWVSAWVDIR